ncbi:TIM-barrel domain-containing protein [Geosporobacter ferrireducens]|uniref:Alpha-glucosidase n=1 Tax=Geosporobacter ferrireducens TaxID=1424294 RepID=A0A1D8GLH6_9FIRM|nr:TIM-barrel domain-containing protein [Geosporobacter ferrireducens]AOT71767.1 alpha-glucosidase [Geosporobacter ferrireducens]
MKVYKINDHIMKYRFGSPFETHSVVMQGELTDKGKIHRLQVQWEETLKINYKMDKEDIIWGLGESQRGMNKRGGIYEAYCSDDPRHTPDKKSLYGAHNFIIIDGLEFFGLYIDFPGKIIFDIGFTHKDLLQIEIEGKDADIYIIKGTKLYEISRNFLELIGESYVPPKWAFGYQQSRWDYLDARAVEEIAEAFEKHEIPCDAIYLDIDYMENFKDFTIDEKKFPQFKQFVKKLREKGLRLIPIIDAGVKIEAGYGVYEEGVEKGYFCIDAEGKPFVAAVWPGRVHFPDFLNPAARKWFGLKYKVLTDYGIEGFWNDMNEPAIFYTERGLQQAIHQAKRSENENLDIYSFFALKDAFINLSNHPQDYQSFYHQVEGKRINHHQVHNLYGYNMTKAAAEGLQAIDPDKRFLLFSRASYIGMHRYAGIWTGDNHSWWEHILLNLKMMPSLNLCGFLYVGADTGGFSGDTNAQMLIRWMQLSLFAPLFRNHSAMGTRKQEPFAFDEESMAIMRRMIQLRYEFIPYIYAEYMKAVFHKGLYFAPLAFAYEDKLSKRVEDQLLVGESLMITPIYQENAVGRTVWLPEEMLLCLFGPGEKLQYSVKFQGHHYIGADLDVVPVFLRKNKLFPIGSYGKNIEALDHTVLRFIGFVEDQASYHYYDDDGITYRYKEGIYDEIAIFVEKKSDDYAIHVKKKGSPKVKKLLFDLIDRRGRILEKTILLV